MMVLATVITASPASRKQLFGNTMTQEATTSLNTHEGASVVRLVYSETGRVFFFPVDQCKTWFVGTAPWSDDGFPGR